MEGRTSLTEGREDDSTVNRRITVEDGDPLRLQSSDHPGMMLVTTPLTGNNYLSWSRSIKIALGAKAKLGFIDGKCVKPKEESAELEQWNRIDYMVTSWLLNSISKEIVEAFLYTKSAKQLWDELNERFGQSNGPLLYQLQREISSISQGDMTVAQYYTKLKRLWDELTCVMPIPECNCGAAKAVADVISSNRLIQFLMGLNDVYDSIRNQILLMDPLPTTNKAYSMVLQVEKQREVLMSYADNLTNQSAMLAKGAGYKRDGGGKWNSRKRDPSKHCTYCSIDGHTREECFKLHGYPDWWKGKERQKGKGPQKGHANMVDTPLEEQGCSNDAAPGMAKLIQAEVAKYMKGAAGFSNFANMKDFAGPTE